MNYHPPIYYPRNPNREAVRWKLRCVSCKQRVTSSDALKGHAYFALGGVWHAQHMTCAKCNVNVAEIPFCESATKKNELQCTDYYMAESNPDCTACGLRLFENAVETDDGALYHKDCFRCKACKNPCYDNTYVVDDVGGIYDVDCYHVLVLGKEYGCSFGTAKSSAEKAEETDSK